MGWFPHRPLTSHATALGDLQQPQPPPTHLLLDLCTHVLLLDLLLVQDLDGHTLASFRVHGVLDPARWWEGGGEWELVWVCVRG